VKITHYEASYYVTVSIHSLRLWSLTLIAVKLTEPMSQVVLDMQQSNLASA